MIKRIFLTIWTLSAISLSALAQEEPSQNGTETKNGSSKYAIFDDTSLLNGYANKYRELPLEIILEMLKDDTLAPYQSAAAVRIFKEVHSADIVNSDERGVEKILLRRLSRTDSAFVQVEVMHTLCKMDRYRYFQSMVPALIQKLDHYNSTVNEMAFDALNDLIESGSNRAREARIVFHTLRKILFLSRKRLATIEEPGPKLKQKLKLLRWSIKILGNQELKRLPNEVINLL